MSDEDDPQDTDPPLPKLEGPVAVTGASGYIASWVVRYLLQTGVTVHGTVRDRSRADKVDHLESLADSLPGELKLFEADLMKPGSFDEAIAGCSIVFHMASPFFIQGVKDAQKELVDPALDGTRNVLQSVEAGDSVRKVVLTASAACIYGDATDLQKIEEDAFNESHWNKSSRVDHNPYSYSKTVAEREAWKIADAQQRWELVTINPTFVAGPSLSKRTDGTSVDTILSMVNGTFRMGVPSLYFGTVDVREVALAHLLAAASEDAEGRHLVTHEEVSLLDIAHMLRAEFGNKYPFPRREVPKFLLYLVGPFLGFNAAFVRNNIGHPLHFDNTKSRESLGLKYRSARATFTEHLYQLEEMGLT